MDEQISNFVLNWARLGHRQYECEISTKRNARPNHVSTSGSGSSKQGGKSLDDDEYVGILLHEVTPSLTSGASFAQIVT
jgi:hypothetical protein